MTKQEYIERLQDLVTHNKITNVKDLQTQFVNEDGTTEQIEVYDEVLSPIEYTFCDRCGNLELSAEACWVDYLDMGNDNDKRVYKRLEEEAFDYAPCAICDMCYHELLEKGE